MHERNAVVVEPTKPPVFRTSAELPTSAQRNPRVRSRLRAALVLHFSTAQVALLTSERHRLELLPPVIRTRFSRTLSCSILGLSSMAVRACGGARGVTATGRARRKADDP